MISIMSIYQQPYNAKFPYDFTVKLFSGTISQTLADVMTGDDPYNGISPNSVLLNFEDDYHLR